MTDRRRASDTPAAQVAGSGVAGSGVAGSGVAGKGAADGGIAGGGEPAAGSAGHAGKDAGDANDSGADASSQPAKPCKAQLVGTASLDVPTIWLAVDGSGSMVDMLGDKSRWVALREALMDPTTGVVKALQHDVEWGLLLYDGPIPGGLPTVLPDGGMAMFSSPPATTCPRVFTVEPKQDNFADIDKVYTTDPLGGSTPTDKALDVIIAHLPDRSAQASGHRAIVVLATDGAPNDFCSSSFPPADVRPSVIAAVNKLAAANVLTYVISLAGDDQMLMTHLSDVAQAGKTGKVPFVPMNKDQLITALKDIVGPEPACNVKLSVPVKLASTCQGSVQLNGATLSCNNADGWGLPDASTLRLMGNACTAYKANATTLHVEFPCAAIASP